MIVEIALVGVGCSVGANSSLSPPTHQHTSLVLEKVESGWEPPRSTETLSMSLPFCCTAALLWQVHCMGHDAH